MRGKPGAAPKRKLPWGPFVSVSRRMLRNRSWVSGWEHPGAYGRMHVWPRKERVGQVE